MLDTSEFTSVDQFFSGFPPTKWESLRQIEGSFLRDAILHEAGFGDIPCCHQNVFRLATNGDIMFRRGFMLVLWAGSEDARWWEA